MQDSMAEEKTQQLPDSKSGENKPSGPKGPVSPEAAGATTADVAGPMLHQVRIPEIIAIMPVRDAVAFPGAVIPLSIDGIKAAACLMM